ncbi:hypothetical protein ACYOEI_08750, partial [Singulisphaera rosea]
MTVSSAGTKSIAQSWMERAGELADWVEAHMVNRRDAFGHYIRPEDRRDPDLSAYTDKSGLTREVLVRHFRASHAGDVIGLHSTARDEASGDGEVGACWSRWIAVDIDR